MRANESICLRCSVMMVWPKALDGRISSHQLAFANFGRFGAALLLAASILGVGARTNAEERSSHASVLLELDASLGGPFGPASTRIGYATAGRWTVGLGVGFFAPSVYQSDWRPLGLFVRAPLNSTG